MALVIILSCLCYIFQPTFNMSTSSPAGDRTPVVCYNHDNPNVDSHQECINYNDSGDYVTVLFLFSVALKMP